VVDCSGLAARYGVRLGQPLRAATALCPALVVIEERPAHVMRVAKALAEGVLTVTPLAEEAVPGTVYADLRGLDGLYRDASTLERALLDAAPPVLQPRLGLADARFTAQVAARSAHAGEALRVERDEAAAFLAGKPAAWLPLDIEAVERLRLFGIETMGEYAALPEHAAAAQFGPTGRLAWHCAHGHDPTPLRPRAFALERVVEHAQSDPPLVSREAVRLTAEQLLIRALRHPRASHRFVRCVRVRATTEDDRLWERTQVLREPTSDRARLGQALRPMLEYAQYPGPIADLELELGGLTSESGRQPSLLDAERVRRREQMDEMVRHLKVRYGESPVARAVEVERWSRIPERRWALMDYDP
jgi:DNA polymerase-4/protein ImuB